MMRKLAWLPLGIYLILVFLLVMTIPSARAVEKTMKDCCGGEGNGDINCGVVYDYFCLHDVCWFQTGFANCCNRCVDSTVNPPREFCSNCGGVPG